MSPEVSIEPLDFIRSERGSKLRTGLILAKAAYCEHHRLSDRGVEFAREPLQFLVGDRVNTNARTLHATQHTEPHTL